MLNVSLGVFLKLKSHIESQFPFLEGKKLLIACSGGIDSVVLTYLLKTLKFNVSLAHCNFSLRGKESDGDEDFVIGLADKFSIPVINKTFDTKEYSKKHKISIQMAARDLRYNWFDELCDKQGFDFVLTAHHLDDDLETFFINLSRGTGLRGFIGIPKMKDKIVRPLLNFSRDEILLYAKENNIAWREDSSNIKTDYLRNQLRIEVIPKFKDVNKRVLQNFKGTQEHLRASQLLVNDYMVLINNLIVSPNKEGYQIDIKKLNELPNKKALLYELLIPYGFTAWDDILALLKAQTGKQVFSKTHRLLKDRNVLLLSEIVPVYDETLKENETEYLSEDIKEITSPIKLKIELVDYIGETKKNMIYVDKKHLTYPLELRRCNEGDIFYPFGMNGKKKLSKFFKDEKLSLLAKEKVWVLCSNDKIVWVIGLRSDDRFKVTSNTRDILKITTKP